MLLLGHKAGLRVTEISRLTVADVMFPSGKLREECSLREAVTKGCRCAYFSHPDLIEAIEAYLAFRLAKGIGVDLDDSPAYRGLLPYMPLIWSSRGDGLSQNTKRRVLQTGQAVDYKCCDSLQSHLTSLYKKAGVPRGSSHSGRRTFANRILEKTGDIDVVKTLLGHADLDCTDRYLDINQGTIRRMFEDAV